MDCIHTGRMGQYRVRRRGSGGGTVTLRVPVNDGPERTSVLTIAGQPFVVTAGGASRGLAVHLRRDAVTSRGGPICRRRAAGVGRHAAACAWTATTETPWITITSTRRCAARAAVTYTVAANPGDSRQGAIAIAGQTIVIDQDAATSCSYAVSPTSLTIGATGGAAGPFTVTTGGACAWTSVSNAPWITVTVRHGTNGDRHR